MIQIYSLPNTTAAVVALHPDDGGRWEIFFAIAGGYASARPWTPAPALAKRVLAEDKHGQIFRAKIFETKHMARWLGLPEGATQPEYGAHHG